MDLSDILAVVCKHESISIKELTVALKERGYSETALIEELSKHHGVITVYSDDREKRCKYSFDIEVCPKPYSNNPDRPICTGEQKCNKLHICKHFLKGKCNKGIDCEYPHDLSSPNNIAFLRKHNLEKVEQQYIYSLIQVNDLAICTFYNNESGCKKSSDSCNFLHICRRFINDACPSPCCELNHDFSETNCKRLLKDHNIDVEYSVTESTEHLFPATPEKKICTPSILRKCHDENCKLEHHVLPYKWFYKADDGWYPFTHYDQTRIEKTYCDVSEESIEIVNTSLAGGPPPLLCFDEMLDKSVFRMSTPSSVAERSSQPFFITEWIWYYKDDYIWKKYSQKSTNDYCVSNKGSRELEDDYQKFLKDPILSTVMFKVGQNNYRLDFSLMQQENITSKTTRKVRRRPALITNEDILKHRVKSKIKRTKSTGAKAGMAPGFPDYWEKEMSDPEASYKLIYVDSESDEYKQVQRLFNYSAEIQNIQRIQNEELWKNYVRKKESMKAWPNERSLWHGTVKQVTGDICQQGFDFRLNGSSSGRTTIYGQGSYFARHASYSDNYAKPTSDGFRYMFLAKVLVGKYILGEASYTRPPEKFEGGTKILYDSCVDNVSDPNIFVTFDNNQVYPEYLVKYR